MRVPAERHGGGDDPDLTAIGVSAFATARCLLLDRHTVETVSALRERGVDSLLLKGPSVAAWLWPGEERLYGDIDLLVSPSSVPLAEAVLAERGLADRRSRSVRTPSSEKSRPWSSSEGGVVVDLHQGIVGVGADNAATWRILWRHRQPLPLGDGEVLALDTPARAVHVVLHAVQHNRHDKPLRDLGRALEVVPVETWNDAAELAGELDALDNFGGGLLLLDGGRTLAEQIGLDPQLTVHLALRVGSPRNRAHGFERLASVGGVHGRVGFVLDWLAPSPEAMRHRSALARRGRAGLVLAYLWRLTRSAGRAVPGFIEWRLARRAAAAPHQDDPSPRSVRLRRRGRRVRN